MSAARRFSGSLALQLWTRTGTLNSGRVSFEIGASKFAPSKPRTRKKYVARSASASNPESRDLTLTPLLTPLLALLAANQGSDTVVVFHIDDKTGRLTHTGQVVEVNTPVCVRFVELN